MSSTAWRHFLWILIKAFLPSFQTRDHQQVESTKVIVKSTPCQLGWTMENGHFLIPLYLCLIYISSEPSSSGHSRVVTQWPSDTTGPVLQSMSSGSEPPDKQYLSTVFQVFLKRFLLTEIWWEEIFSSFTPFL